MTPFAQNSSQWLAEARQGSREALGQLLEAYRAYLLLLAQRELDPELRSKGGASDLVQQTFLEAQRDFSHFRGETEAELAGWLRQILMNNLASFSRRYRETAKRKLGCEVSLEAAPQDQEGLRQALADPAANPVQEAIHHEEAGLVNSALGRLPEDYRQALLLRYRDGLSFEEIGRHLQRSPNAASKLWLRAVERLQAEVDSAGPRGTGNGE